MMIKLKLLQLRIWLMSHKNRKRERYIQRYNEIIRKPIKQLTDKDCRDFERIYEYFNGDIEMLNNSCLGKSNKR